MFMQVRERRVYGERRVLTKCKELMRFENIRGESESLTINAFSVSELIEKNGYNEIGSICDKFCCRSGGSAAGEGRAARRVCEGIDYRKLMEGYENGNGGALRPGRLAENKAAAQCAHAAINCYKRALTDAPKDLRRWETQGQTKVVVKVSGEAELMEVAENAQAEGLVAVVIHDSDSAIVLGIGPGPTALVDKVAGHLRLY
ncbi:uncharacterized protein LOC124374372 [Homalodisca vitripennis]|uniref:uncharacterized protein LOC124374372 n=1 Tax=Homalodisca vitripennis TaxID=197043 RepID=UPI001EEAE399|nr:uncharacterized protein LOC124374372 [Homalodisca vitripennis]